LIRSFSGNYLKGARRISVLIQTMTDPLPDPILQAVTESADARALRTLYAEVVEKAARGGAQDHDFMSDVVRQLLSYRDNEPALQADIMLEVAKYFYYRAQDAHRGIEAAMQAASIARRAGLKPLVRKADSFLGILSMVVRNFRGAIDHSITALELAVELDDRLAQSAVANNIGGFLLELFYYEDALRLFRFALATAPATSQGQQVTRSTMCNMALIYLAKHDFQAGIDTIRSAIQLLGEPGTAADLSLRVLMEWCYTRLLLATGKTPDARLHAAFAKVYAAKANTPRATFYADASEAMCEAYEGNGDVALTRLIVALEKSRAISADQRDMLASIIQIAEHMGDDERADYYMQELKKLAVDVQRDSQLDLEVLHTKGFKKDKGSDTAAALSVIQTHYDQQSRERVRRAIAKAS
jgi:Tfp pilus assembly protein PilF